MATSSHLQRVMEAAEGDLDPTFGTNGDGKVQIDFGNQFDQGNGVAVQSDGKLVVAGNTFDGSQGDFAVARLNADGTLDPTFGNGGRVTTDFNGNQFDLATAMALQADGKIVVVGSTNEGAIRKFGVARYNSDGSLDTSFNGTGTATVEFGSFFALPFAVGVQVDGKIVVAGSNAIDFFGDRDFALARFNPDGSLDPSFDGDGRVTTDLAGNGADEAFAVAIQSDGRIVAAGIGVPGPFAAAQFALVRYQPDGSLDPTFDTDGKLLTAVGADGSLARAVVVQLDGKIVAAGDRFRNFVSGDSADFALVRYNTDGTLDTSFDGDGIVTTDFGNADEQPAAVTLQADGKIVVAGTRSFFVVGGSIDFLLARYAADGALDASFGVNGSVTTDFGGRDQAHGMAIQPDGDIVMVGTAESLGSADMALARFDGPAPHDVTFFLHGNDIPGTAGGFTMNQTAPAAQFLVLLPGSTPNWFSNPAVNGTFLSGATFRVVLPCTGGVALAKTVRLASTDLAGGSEQLLGQASEPFRVCARQTIAVPVMTPATFANRRLKLTIVSNAAGGVHLPLLLGAQTRVTGTTFVGAP